MITFAVTEDGARLDPTLRNVVQLLSNNWDDYSYKTLFSAYFTNGLGEVVQLGSVKIGFRGQSHGWTKAHLPSHFQPLPEGWFSVGQDVEYYEKLRGLGDSERNQILSGLRDVAADESTLMLATAEHVFVTSLMRGVSESVVRSQYRRVLNGEAVLTDYDFKYYDEGGERRSPVDLEFAVVAGSSPPTNVHVIIGRNGVGKTSILNGMVAAVHPAYSEERTGAFQQRQHFSGWLEMYPSYFSGVISVSFSVFDPFIPPEDNVEPALGPKYAYLGMKRCRRGARVIDLSLKAEPDLIDEFVDNFRSCIAQSEKTSRWLRAIEMLSSDTNFASMELPALVDEAREAPESALASARAKMERMSSGHKIVILTMTALVNLVEEKTLVLMDEPESHLHPPLLSAFTRAVSELLHDRNGVAIMATHSPVVVQEVPRACVWKINRSGIQWRKDRPELETFGENVGVLTKEVFALEVTKSGFHALLQHEVNQGKSLDHILSSFGHRLGMEGTAVLMAMIAARSSASVEGRQ